MIILAVRRRSWRELDSWSFGGGLFSVLFNIFSYEAVISKNLRQGHYNGRLRKGWQIRSGLTIVYVPIYSNSMLRLLIPPMNK